MLVEFQFYLSSIKSLFMGVMPNSQLGFQFYLSSIKRKNLPSYLLQWKSFNSTLVQLKVAIYHVVPLLDYGFNSTLVQLKDSSPRAPRVGSIVSILP